MEQLKYIADQRDIELPENFPNFENENFYEEFLECMQNLDGLFLEKLHFYLAREKINYSHLDNFLNVFILRFWPDIMKLMITKLNERKLREDNTKKSEDRAKKRLYNKIVVNSSHK